MTCIYYLSLKTLKIQLSQYVVFLRMKLTFVTATITSWNALIWEYHKSTNIAQKEAYSARIFCLIYNSRETLEDYNPCL